MKRMFRGVALSSLCLTLAACGSARYYTLPVDPNLVGETQTMIGTCASEAGLESYKDANQDLVAVKYDETAMLYYRYQGGDANMLNVIVDDSLVQGPALEQKQRDAKAKGDEIYQCAQARLYPPQPVVMMAAPPPPPPPAVVHANSDQVGVSVHMSTDMSAGMSMSMQASSSATTTTSASVGVGGPCARAIECYAQLHKKLCEGATECSFKAEVSGNSDASCRDALRQARETVRQMSMFKPGLTAPAVCQAE
ncbi:hypothetical protein P2318_20070 [Myxococcaceae bacterium GXIMD 01537]